jgi:predicted nucleic acid-binding protein
MSDKYFLDTNIIIYSVDLTNPLRRKRTFELVRDGAASKRVVISYQVVQEFINVARRKFQSAVVPADLESYLQDVLFPMMAVPSSPWLFIDALRLHHANQLSRYDSLIVAAAMQGRCKILYSEDLQDRRRFGDLVVENPF